MVEAILSNNLDFGMWGTTPIVRLIAQKQPMQVLSVGEGHFRFVLGTRRGSPIRNMADLRGKTVGAVLGADSYNVLSQMLRYELGNADPHASNITIVNTPTPAQAATIPAGMDAAIVAYPAFLKASSETDTVGIMNSFGYTESYYRGPAGEGAGHLLESVKRSPFYPDGYYLHRSFWIVNPNIHREHPAVITAFLVAQQDALGRLQAMDPGQVSQLVKKDWELEPNVGSLVVKDDVLFARGWCWPTEGDANAILEASKFMVEARVIQQPLVWSQVRDAFAPAAPQMQAAYEKSGRKPDAAVFTSNEAKDLRGLPVWEMRRWRDRT
jgi:ABC-type nitrate/sulfonate/bicarbonate transport system substrate-binding protein